MERRGVTGQTIGDDRVVADAIVRMNERRSGALLVVHGNRVMGMVTDLDLLSRVIAVGRDPRSVKVGEVMRTDFVTVSQDAELEEAMELMNACGLRHLPVASDERICGIVSQREVAEWLVQERDARISDLVLFITHG